ncbi:EVE domain-containing protein [Paenibacillus mesophilus]|uniref:EVE domain-containing protein n=1 Tax=Paenibacillus mesophilus TaxID=2582849 RepID=UPI00110D762D|nr:EVE domain-containing protein [Paenibacillus mesophilus]TMV47042.1 EVE domain-containing protein [Paenibacillus mesophilus]
MHFIFVVNDMDLGSLKLNGEDIIKELLSKKIWVYSKNAPNIMKINKGSKVILYLAGKGRRSFVCSFELSDDIKENDTLEPILDESYSKLFTLFKLSSPLTNIKIFNNKVNISDIKESLDFIVDKKNYGLYFRQSTKVISEKDYDTILSLS